MANSYNELFGLGSHSEDASLALYLKLQETSGTTAVDSSSNGNDGTITGMGSGPTYTSGPNNWLPSAFDFDGSDDYVDLDVITTSGDNHTLLMFMKNDNDPPGLGDKTGFGWFGEGAASGGASHFPFTDGNVYCSTFRGIGSAANSRVTVGNPTPALTSWRKVCVKTTPGANGWKFRIDGSDIATDTGIASLYMDGETWIGRSTDNFTSYWYEGAIAGVAKFDRHLSDAEEAEYFSGPEPLRLTDPTLSMAGGTSYSGNVGTWDSQLNGTVSCAWELRDADDDSVVASGTAASGGSISGSGSFTGEYYLFVRASNDGGYDAGEDFAGDPVAADGGFFVVATDTLSLSDEAPVNYEIAIAASDTLTMTDESDGFFTQEFDETIEETLALTDIAEFEVYFGDSTDSLSLTDSATGVVDVAVPPKTATDTLTVTDTATCRIEYRIDETEPLTISELQVNPDTLEVTVVNTGLRDNASTPKDVVVSVNETISFSESPTNWLLSPGGIEVSADDSISLSDDGRKSETGTALDSIAIVETVDVATGIQSSDRLSISDVATSLVESRVSASDSLVLTDKLASIVVGVGNCDLKRYDESQAGPYAAEALVSGFRLRYPATSHTTEVVLRAPNLGNKDRISMQRINRLTRGGTLIIYRDPIWPLIETLALSFSALNREEALALQQFMQDSLGDEIALIDWENREWRGVITVPDDPIVEDRKNSYSASFTFEGTKV